MPLSVPPAGVQRVDEGGWNTVQGAKNSRVLDPSKFLKITKVSMTFKHNLPHSRYNSFSESNSCSYKIAI